MTARIPVVYGALCVVFAYLFVSWLLLAAAAICFALALQSSRRALLPFGVVGRSGPAGTGPAANVPAEQCSPPLAARRVDAKARR